MWMIVYFWRLLNPHTLMQFILLSVLYNRTHEYLTSIQFLGFLPITVLGGSLLEHWHPDRVVQKILQKYLSPEFPFFLPSGREKYRV